MPNTRVYLAPGMFGFSTLGSYHYFCHVEEGIKHRFQALGRTVEVHHVNVHPTASIRRRARKFMETVDDTFGNDGPIHLVGHSTGGLDARLVASPTMNVSGQVLSPKWMSSIRSVTTINTPHFGTPLASFFATLSGQRLLYAISAMTIVMLKLGKLPLSLTSWLIGFFSDIEKAAPIQLRIIEKLTEDVVRLLGSATAKETDEFLRMIREDQGSIIQLSPESMDLFQAGVEDSDHVYYQSVATYVPTPGFMQWAGFALSPWSTLTLPVFFMLQRLTSLEHNIYPCAPIGTEADDKLRAFLNEPPKPLANDGVVPIRSQVWGKLAWAGKGDHLDVVGHFHDPNNNQHVDWLSSGSGFDYERFNSMLDAIVDGMLQSEQG